MLELVLRLGISLAVVLGLFWLVARTGARRLGGTRGLMRVHGRQTLSRTASVAVVEVGTRVLVVGVSDGGVRLLTELDPEDIAVEATRPTPAPVAAASGPTARLAGLLASRLTGRGGTVAANVDGLVAADVDGLVDDVAPVTPAAPARTPGAAVAVPVPVALPSQAVPDASDAGASAAPGSVGTPAPAAAAAARLSSAGAETGALSGSLLAPQTWRQAWAAATSRSGTPIADSVAASLAVGAPRPGDRVHG